MFIKLLKSEQKSRNKEPTNFAQKKIKTELKNNNKKFVLLK